MGIITIAVDFSAMVAQPTQNDVKALRYLQTKVRLKNADLPAAHQKVYERLNKYSPDYVSKVKEGRYVYWEFNNAPKAHLASDFSKQLIAMYYPFSEEVLHALEYISRRYNVVIPGCFMSHNYHQWRDAISLAQTHGYINSEMYKQLYHDVYLPWMVAMIPTFNPGDIVTLGMPNMCLDMADSYCPKNGNICPSGEMVIIERSIIHPTLTSPIQYWAKCSTGEFVILDIGNPDQLETDYGRLEIE